MTRVFLSYAIEDNVPAKRIYDDLRGSGLDVWGFEEDGEIAVNFLKEFSSQLTSRRYFCLLDSANARKSNFVRIECEIANKRMGQDPDFSMIPCLIQPKAPFSVWWVDELFENQNLVTYIDLTDYQKGIRRLCKHLGTVFCPVSEFPQDQDFREEIFSADLDRDTAAELIDMYAKFRKECTGRPHIAKNWLANLIAILDDLEASTIVSPRIALAILESENDRHTEAADVFRRLAELQPDEPRAWAGLGGALFYLCDYEGSFEAYKQCKEAILKAPTDDNITHLSEVSHNTARVLLALGEPHKALDEINCLDDVAKVEVHIKALRGKILLELKKPVEAISYLEAALDHFDNLQLTPPASLLVDLADCYRILHRDADEEKIMLRGMNVFNDDPELLRRLADRSLYDLNFESALNFLKKALEVEPDSIIYRAELASIMHYQGDTRASRQEAKRCLQFEDELGAQIPRCNYYLGLAYYIIGKHEIAENKLKKARRMDSVIAGWPSYRDLLN